MTPRRAHRAHNPTAAFWWGTAKWCALIGASAALGVALALVGAEAIFRGRWTVTGEAASVAFVGVVLGALAAVAHALMVHAIDGPPVADLVKPWTFHEECMDCGVRASECQCPGGVRRVRPVLDDETVADMWRQAEALAEVDDDVRADAHEHADEDDPFGVIGGAP